MLRPKHHFHRVWDIPSDWVKAQGLRVLLLDVDNTLTTHDNQQIPQEVRRWIGEMQQVGIRLLLVSNNSPERVSPFAKEIGLGFIADAHKPLPNGVRRACRRLRVKPRQVAIVGDQLFTDVLCANCAGAVSVLVDYMEKESMPFFKVKRKLERWIYPSGNAPMEEKA